MKKRLLSICLVLALCLACVPSALAVGDGHFSGGTGTPSDPYQISTAQDLFDLGVIERIIRQPKAGDHAMFESLKMLIKRTFEKNLALDDEELLNARYERFRKIGRPE